jgi:hypothetical protein
MSNGEMMDQRADEAQLPTWARVLLRVLFREGPVVILTFLMAAVIMGLIPSPYLGDKLDSLQQSHQEQIRISRDQLEEFKAFHEEFRAWRQDGYRERRAR